MEGITKTDALFYLGAYKKKVDEAYKALKAECDAEMLEEYRLNGSTQKRSRLFGKGAGTYTVPVSEATEPHEQVDFAVCDMDAFEEWLVENPQAALQWSLMGGSDVGEWWFSKTGELPDGISRTAYTVEGKPEMPGTPTLRVKPDVVAKAVDAGVLEEVRRLALGEGDLVD